MALAFRFAQGIDEARLRLALQSLTGRHELLRSSMDACDLSRLRIGTDQGVTVSDLGPQSETQVTTSIATFKNRFSDLTASTAFNCAKLHDPAGEILVAVVHHLIADARGLDVLATELLAAYRGQRVESAPSWREHVARQMIKSSDARAQARLRDHWTKKLAGVTPIYLPPTDSPPQLPGARLQTTIEAKDVRNGTLLAERLGVTSTSVALAGIIDGLRRHTGHQHVAWTGLWSGRERQATRNLFGLTTRLVPMRVRTPLSADFASLVADVHREVMLGALYSVPPYTLCDTLAHLYSAGALPPAPTGGVNVWINIVERSPQEASDLIRRVEPSTLDMLRADPVPSDSKASRPTLGLQCELSRKMLRISAIHNPVELPDATVAALLDTIATGFHRRNVRG